MQDIFAELQNPMQFKNKQLKKTAQRIRHRIEKMLGWTAESQTNVEAGKPYLRERKGVLALHFDASSVQSEMSIDLPDELVFSYTKAMMSFLLFEPSPKRIAMIGLGGGSLAKYCYRYLPQAEITVVEINPDVIALRNEFAIPADDARFKVLLGDGAMFVTDTAMRPDVLIVDGFDTGGLPARLSSQQFYDDCFASLADSGIMVANLWSDYTHYGECLARIRNSFAGNLAIVNAEDSPNKIVIALKNLEFPPSLSIIRHHAKLLCLSHPLNFQEKSNKLIRALLIGGDAYQ
ncbi:MAG: transferase [Gallionella sp.]|nr:transferase [Gallionella sp.]